MKAVIYEKKGAVRLVDKPMPVILGQRDAIVKVMRASICSSDLHIRNGRGRPRERGRGRRARVRGRDRRDRNGREEVFGGRHRVAVNVESFCGECFFCRRGYVNNCVEGGWELGCRIDGGQAELCPRADRGHELHAHSRCALL